MFHDLLIIDVYTERQHDLEYEDFIYDVVLMKRNKQMTNRIIKLMETNDKVKFFAAGVAHYLGDDSVVEMLRKRGYIVTRMMATDSVLQLV